MGWSFRFLRVRGIEIKVHATFILILLWAAYYWGVGTNAGLRGALFGIVATLLLFACVTLHELGHSFQAMAYGLRVRDITLLPIGGVAQIETIPDDPRQEFRIAIAGPLVNVAIAAVLIVIGAVLRATSLASPGSLADSLRGAEWSGLLPYLTVANIYLAVFNIIPAFPMDGGRILRALLAMRMSYRRATEIAVGIGQAVALLFGLAGFATGNFFLILIAIFVWIGAGQEGQQVVVRNVLGRATVGDAMTRRPLTVGIDDPLSQAVDLTLSTAQADFPVLDATGQVVGLLTADDLIKGLRDGRAATAGQAMHQTFPLATPEEPLVEAQQRISTSGVRAVPVVTGDRQLAGLLTLADIGEAYRLLSIQPELLSRQAGVRRVPTEGRMPV